MASSGYSKLDQIEASGEVGAAEVSPDGQSSLVVRVKLPNDKTLNVDVGDAESCTVLKLKELIEQASENQFTVPCQRLVHAGRILSDGSATLASHSVQDQTIVHLFPLSKEQAEAVQARSSEPARADVGATGDEASLPSFQRGRRYPFVPPLWQARVRLISITGLFYFTLVLLDELPYIFGLEKLDKQLAYSEFKDKPELFLPMFLMGCLLHIVGAIVCIMGLKASREPHSLTAGRFYRGCLCCIFLASAETLIFAAVHYTSSAGSEDPKQEEADSLVFGMDFFLRACLSVLVWATSRNYYLLILRQERAAAAAQ
jgi:hypothetical protein|eukprot:g156.t1